MRLLLLGDGEALDLMAELVGRLGYQEIVRSEDPPREVGPEDQVVIECRDPRRARKLVAAVLALGEPAYVGLCASEKDAVVALLRLSADRVPRALLDRLFAPAGVPIHAATPDERAISVVAQLIAERRTPRSSLRPSA